MINLKIVFQRESLIILWLVLTVEQLLRTSLIKDL